jgi:hypothetical protein
MKKIQNLVNYFNIVQLFNILAVDGEISRNKLIRIIQDFELPFDVAEFFSPIGNKDLLDFTDFCKLFKSNSYENNMFYKTFASSFHTNHGYKESKDLFPITVKPR